jgi:chitinase
MGSRGHDLASIRADKLTHINYAFASIIDGEIAFRFRSPEQETRIRQNISTLNGLRQANPGLKILVSVGGWGNCAGFSDAALTPESRVKFARSGVRMMKDFGFDGIDLDWEYPGQVGGGEVFRPVDKENFTLMLKALREQFDRTGSPALLTIATGADEAYFRWTNLGDAHKYLDFINIMAYDFYSGLSTVSGHHANLQTADSPGAIPISAVVAVNRHLDLGVPAGKLVVGVPFYGRYWRGVPETNHGLYQQGSTTGQYKVYTELLDQYINKHSFTRFWDISAKAPYLYSKDSAMVISYEDPESLSLKADYVKVAHLGGLMFWEYFGDRSGSLLDTIYSGLMRKEE